MAKNQSKTWDEILDALRQQGFDVASHAAVAGGVLVSRNGAGAVLVASASGAAYAVEPGIVVRGELARLLDRGYQKFFKTTEFEIPATAGQLHSIHEFGQQLSLALGQTILFNQSLGSTSDLYQYDRVKGREAEQPAAARPWETTAAH